MFIGQCKLSSGQITGDDAERLVPQYPYCSRNYYLMDPIVPFPHAPFCGQWNEVEIQYLPFTPGRFTTFNIRSRSISPNVCVHKEQTHFDAYQLDVLSWMTTLMCEWDAKYFDGLFSFLLLI